MATVNSIMPGPRPFTPTRGGLLAAVVPLALLVAGLYPSLAARQASATKDARTERQHVVRAGDRWLLAVRGKQL